jgi:hypothetical protein
MTTVTDKICYRIYERLKVDVMLDIDYTKIFVTTAKCMTMINQNGNLMNFEKKTIVVKIIMLLVAEYGNPQIKEAFTQDVIEKLVEQIYINNLHRGVPKGGCIIL